MVKALICGGRDFNDYEYFKTCLDIIFLDIKDDIEIVSGGAKGADLLSEKYAKENDYQIKIFKPNWSLGKKAGPIRNKEMLEYIKNDNSSLVVSFWDGKSKGTKNMIDISNKAGIKVQICKY